LFYEKTHITLGVFFLSVAYNHIIVCCKRQKLFLQTFHGNLPSANMSGRLVNCCQHLPIYWQVPINLHPIASSVKSQNAIVASVGWK